MAAMLVLLPLLWSRSHHQGTLVGEGLKLAGMILIGVGMIGRIWSSAYIAGHKDLELVTAGPYSLCRNPLYFFSLLGSLGVGLSTATVLIPVVIGLLFSVVYPAVIRREEADLRKRFGERFEAFRAITPCFWPRRTSFRDGGVVPLISCSFRRRAFECGWFLWAAGLVGAITAAQTQALLPVWWHIY